LVASSTAAGLVSIRKLRPPPVVFACSATTKEIGAQGTFTSMAYSGSNDRAGATDLIGGPPPAGLISDEANSVAVQLSPRRANEMEMECRGAAGS
jgi:hypothetical protein